MPTKKAQWIKLLVDSGRITADLTTGQIYGYRGKPLKTHPKSRHLAITLTFIGQRSTVYVHKILGYMLFGDIALEEGSEIDHVNNEPVDNRSDNLALLARPDHMQKSQRVKWFRVVKDGSTLAFFKNLEDAHLLASVRGAAVLP